MAFGWEPMDERYSWRDVKLALGTWKDLDPAREAFVQRMDTVRLLLLHGRVTIAEAKWHLGAG